MSEYHRPETWGEKPDITREDVLRYATDIYSSGNSELANRIVDDFDEGEGWVVEHLRKYYGLSSDEYYENFNSEVDGIV